jgi:hypothetical protein
MCPSRVAKTSQSEVGARCPMSIRLSPLASMVNFELAEHPVYDGGELQWFDDATHGTGMLVFLSRREDRSVDYYQSPGLRLDRAGYEIGGGTRSWNLTDFETARLQVAVDGVMAQVRFRDVEGRLIDVHVDDRDGRPRRRAGLLAPVSAGIEHPTSLLLVWMPAFDLVRRTGTPPVIRIDGVEATTGRLPGARLHRRHLIKYAAPVLAVEVNRAHEGDVPTLTAEHEIDVDGRLLAISAADREHHARLHLEPGLPPVEELDADRARQGRWGVQVDGTHLTGGTWTTEATPRGACLRLDVDEQWRPGRLPWLMELVTRLMPVFRRWPTTYSWQCDIQLDSTPRMTSHWQRSTSGAADSYRRATGS